MRRVRLHPAPLPAPLALPLWPGMALAHEPDAGAAHLPPASILLGVLLAYFFMRLSRLSSLGPETPGDRALNIALRTLGVLAVLLPFVLFVFEKTATHRLQSNTDMPAGSGEGRP